MPDEVLHRTLDDLAAIGFAGRLSYHLYNEPLLRNDLPRVVALVAERLPDALQILNTNGDLLDDLRYDQLRQAGIDYFYVTRHVEGGGKGERVERVEGKYPERQFQVVQSYRDLTLTNRGGTVTTVPLPKPYAARTPCFAPSEMLVVSASGEVLLCYEDADRNHVVGNILTTPLMEIWDAEPLRAMRKRLADGDRSVDPMCLRCSNLSHRAPGLSALEDPIVEATGVTQGDPGSVTALKQRASEARALAYGGGAR
jgi:cyclic pyranopterin phosphate synthase